MDNVSDIELKFAALEEMGLKPVTEDPLSKVVERVDGGSFKIHCTLPAMGTLVSITAFGKSASLLEEACDLAFVEMSRLIGLLSSYDGSSALSCLNSDGFLKDPPKELAGLISASGRIHKLSNGAFDITVEPIVDLFRRSVSSSLNPPTAAEISDALELVGTEHIKQTRKGICLNRSGMKLSFNGIAKGFIVDAMSTVMGRCKVENFLINAGGDIRSSGKKEGGEAWSVAVQDPSKNEEYPEIIQISGAAVATSGSYEKSFNESLGVHHIVSSSTGMSPNENVSATVVAPTAMIADALATGVFVLNPAAGIRLVESTIGCECLLIDSTGKIFKTRGWKSSDFPDNTRMGQNAEAVYV